MGQISLKLEVKAFLVFCNFSNWGMYLPEEAGRAKFNVATPTYATVAYSVRKFTNKPDFELLQEGFNVEPQRIFG